MLGGSSWKYSILIYLRKFWITIGTTGKDAVMSCCKITLGNAAFRMVQPNDLLAGLFLFCYCLLGSDLYIGNESKEKIVQHLSWKQPGMGRSLRCATGVLIECPKKMALPLNDIMGGYCFARLPN